MKKLMLFLMVSSGSVCFAAFKMDALNVTTSSMTVNGISYAWPSVAPTSDGLCLSGTNSNPVVLSWVDCSGGGAPSEAVNFALLEDDTYILLEDDSKMRLEH